MFKDQAYEGPSHTAAMDTRPCSIVDYFKAIPTPPSPITYCQCSPLSVELMIPFPPVAIRTPSDSTAFTGCYPFLSRLRSDNPQLVVYRI
jgi:hypothetical protein